MKKRIFALVIALVLCASVLAMPASANSAYRTGQIVYNEGTPYEDTQTWTAFLVQTGTTQVKTTMTFTLVNVNIYTRGSATAISDSASQNEYHLSLDSTGRGSTSKTVTPSTGHMIITASCKYYVASYTGTPVTTLYTHS